MEARRYVGLEDDFPLASKHVVLFGSMLDPKKHTKQAPNLRSYLEDDFPSKFSDFRVPCQFSWMYSP